ncbi:MAG: hypothetical protein AB3N13_01575 [Arenibacterium sp.]
MTQHFEKAAEISPRLEQFIEALDFINLSAGHVGWVLLPYNLSTHHQNTARAARKTAQNVMGENEMLLKNRDAASSAVSGAPATGAGAPSKPQDR